DDMENDAAYREWVDGHCEGRCPNGEIKADFDSRVCAAFERIARGFEGERLIIVAHGGTIMSVMSAFAEEKRPFYRWYVPNCGIYRAELTVFPDSMLISDCELLDRLPG
ncbi:MAG: histidine phosphatase family protein, partial [Oscillospiraceae bacterium]|nr:histidine phosphatase family protein [Oscillospiraceae bacterium]